MGPERNKRAVEQYSDQVLRLFPELHLADRETQEKDIKVLARTVTFQVTDDCNLACKYCYQINKGKRSMSLETAKKFVDLLLDADETNEYINPVISPFVVLDFIGGEPLLEIELIDQIVDYFKEQTFQRMHPWASRFVVSICSNGTLYNDERVQKFFSKNKNHVSFSITIDGNKELHDSCRIFHDGSPSYEIAVAAAKDWMSRGYYMGSKITIAPENVTFLYDALIHMIDLGYEDINANCVYEEGWELPHATELYNQMRNLSVYLLENGLDNIFISLFEENHFKPKNEEDNENWCGGLGSMLSCDPDGYLYPCIRYMESSLGKDQPALRIGHVDTGLLATNEEKQILDCMNCVTRRSQSTDECFNCPIAEGCSWCSAYNYQEFGTVDKRATYICIMHKARSLANVFYWNKYYSKNNIDKKFPMYCPEKDAIDIIGKEEYEYLLTLSGGSLNENKNK